MRRHLINVIIIFVAAGLIFLTTKLLNKESIAEGDGSITIIVIDETGKKVIEDTLLFYEGDKLVEILDEHYTIRTKRFGDAEVIFEINEIKTDFVKTYFAIYVNDQYAEVGISGIDFKDGDTIMFKVEGVR